MLKRFVLIIALLAAHEAHAVLDIRITQGMEEALPIAVIPFDWQGPADSRPPINMHVTIGNDLARSGRFRPMDVEDMPQRPGDFQDINFGDWRLLGIENVLIGTINTLPDGTYEIQFRLVDVYRGAQIAGFRIPATREQFRRTAHRISDIVFEELTGIPGAFDTRIAYITVEEQAEGGKLYALQIADADGFNPRTLLESSESLMSPAWSPDGNRLAYVSFEGRNSSIFIQDIRTGEREQVASYEGINSAPSFSPDGRRLALTLSREGNPEIYILHLQTGRLQRITRHRSIDTEPCWSPDGDRLVFTSDRGGSPQIYEVRVNGGQVRRLTFEGQYNARPRFSPDGRVLTMVHGNNGQYRIALKHLEDGYLEVLSDGRLDESPSFAPNGSMIIYATSGRFGSELAAVSSDGRVHQQLALQDGEVREPAWGPFQSAP